MNQHRSSLSTEAQKVETQYYLSPVDRFLKQKLMPFVPLRVGTRFLTLSMLLMISVNILLGFFIHTQPQFLFLLALSIFLTHILDLLDGEVGRQRKEGYVLWGYYMDKVVDFAVLGSLLLALSLIYPSLTILFFIIALLYGALILNSVAYFACTQLVKKTSGKISPTEAKMAMILLLIAGSFLSIPEITVLFVVVAVVLGLQLFVMVNQAQNALATKDLSNRASEKK